jgi:hypothetical protein
MQIAITSVSFRIPGITKPGHFCTWANECVTGRRGYCQHLFDDHFSIASGGAAEDLTGVLSDIQRNANLISRNFCEVK